LYVVTRNDLNHGQQASQICHAMRQFISENSEVENNWFCNSNYICLLSVPSEEELKTLIFKAINKNIKYSLFKEPDLNDSITAVCFEPSKITKRLLSKLQLAFQ
jgi:peptidyl-tRNA hydrolase